MSIGTAFGRIAGVEAARSCGHRHAGFDQEMRAIRPEAPPSSATTTTAQAATHATTREHDHAATH